MSGQEFGDCGWGLESLEQKSVHSPGTPEPLPRAAQVSQVTQPLPPQSHLFLTSLRLSFTLEKQEDNYSDKHLKIDLKCLFFLSGDGGSVAQLWPTLRPHELQHARLPRPSVSPRVCSDSCLLSLAFSLYSELMVSCLSIVALCTSKTSSAAADRVVTVLFSKHFVHLTPWTLNSGCASVSWAACQSPSWASSEDLII